MNLVLSSTTDPYWNLATEEYLLKSGDSEYIFLYVNKPVVVVGKHQIVPKEINAHYIDDNNILIARRLTGGGAVFHDEGNLNFSFIRTNKSNESISYKEITQSIYDFLHSIGINISLSDRNDFMYTGKKVSGSAMHIFKNRVLAHNTLLVHCNLNQLSNSLAGNTDRFTDKSITSVRSKVMNLNEFNPELTTSLLTKRYTEYLHTKSELNIHYYSFSENENKEIEKISKSKYSSEEWIFNYSPKYSYRNSILLNDKIISYDIEIEKGIIMSVKLEQVDEINNSIIQSINSIKGLQHNYKAMLNWHKSVSQSLIEKLLFNSLF